jgi:TatD DNase family protein
MPFCIGYCPLVKYKNSSRIVSNMILLDAHCHLDHCFFKDDLDNVIENAKKAGVKVIITAGINPESNRKVLKLQEKYDIVKASLGIYPVDALQKEIDAGDYPMQPNIFNPDKEIAWIKEQNPIAIGECGMDFFWIKNKNKEQAELFQKMINMAEKLNVPIIVHSRKAERECVDMLKKSKIKKVILHCFSGKKKLVREAADLGWYFTVPTNIVRSHQFQDLVKMVNLSQLLTETDSPYLTPFKEKRNEPAFVVESVIKIAQLKGMDKEEVANNIFMNYQQLFQ